MHPDDEKMIKLHAIFRRWGIFYFFIDSDIDEICREIISSLKDAVPIKKEK